MRSGYALPLLLTAALILVAFGAAPLIAQKEEVEILKPRFQFGIGGFWPTMQTQLRLDANDFDLGTTITLEDDLSLAEREFTPLAWLDWRVGGGHHFWFGYFDVKRSGDTTLETEIEWGDVTFPISENVHSRMDTEVLFAAYAYDFLRKRERTGFGVSGGLHITKVFASIEGEKLGVEEDAETTAPLPLIGIFGGHAFAKRWAFWGRVQLFALEFDNYDGRLINAEADFFYQPWRHVGFSFGWNYFGIRLEVDKDRYRGRVDWQYNGPAVMIRFLF